MHDDEFKKVCIEQKWNSNLAQEYYDIISKIFDDALENDAEFNKKFIDRQNEFHRTALPNYNNWLELCEKIRININVKSDEVDLIFLIRYLITVESLASHYATVLYYACYKAYDNKNKAYHESFNTIHNYVLLGPKLKYLENKGLAKYTNSINRFLRNQIGHMTFKINNGKIEIPEDQSDQHGYKKVNIEQMGTDLDMHILAMYAAIWRYYSRYSKVPFYNSDFITHL